MSALPLGYAFVAAVLQTGEPLFESTGLGFHPIELDTAKNSIEPAVVDARTFMLQRADLGLAPPAVEPGKHLVKTAMIGIVPAELALPLGFLNDYHERMDALGLAYLVTGDVAYAELVGEHLLVWSDYSPPNGVGRREGAEPGIMHRNFAGLFRATWNTWEVLDAAERAASVQLARTLLSRLEDWWSLTPWIRGNHAAAANLTAAHAIATLSRAQGAGDLGVGAAEIEAHVQTFLIGAGSVPPAAIVGGQPSIAGLVGFERQVGYGIFREELRSLYEQRFDSALLVPGTSLDFCYKPNAQRLEYHSLVLNHWLTTLWVLRRNGLQDRLQDPALVHDQISSAIEFLRGTWVDGIPPDGAVGDSPDVTAVDRENMALADALFPGKTWIDPLLDREGPPSVLELYTSSALPLAGSEQRTVMPNATSLSTDLPILGRDLLLTVDLATTGHSAAAPFAFASRSEVPLANGQVLLTNDPNGLGEFLAAPAISGPSASLDVPVPALTSLLGFRMTLQAVHFGDVVPYALSNARDLVLGAY